MSISTWTTSNPKKIREFNRDMQNSIIWWFKQIFNKDKPMHEFEDDSLCRFCGEVTKWGIMGGLFTAALCPECFEKGRRGELVNQYEKGK
jgi:hypothetical protein